MKLTLKYCAAVATAALPPQRPRQRSAALIPRRRRNGCAAAAAAATTERGLNTAPPSQRLKKMEWGNVAGWAAAFVAFVAVNASTIQWLLKRRDEQHQRDSGRVDELEKQLTDLRVALPMEYVRREDWIRFSGTLDAKLDAMREEMREDIAEVKERLYAGRN